MKIITAMGPVTLDDKLVQQLTPSIISVSNGKSAYHEIERIIRVAMQAEMVPAERQVARRMAISQLAAQNIAQLAKTHDLSAAASVAVQPMDSFQNLGFRAAGGRAAESGQGVDQNPHKPGTNEHLLWLEGHATVRQSTTPVNHTYQVDDVVRFRSTNDREQQIANGEDPNMVIESIRDVPEDEQVYQPDVDWRDSTGVGHHQHLFIRGRTAPISGKVVELADDVAPVKPHNPDDDMPTLGAILEQAIKDRGNQ